MVQEGGGLAAAGARRQAVFAQLRPVCSQLLVQRTDAQALHQRLTTLQALLEQQEPQGLLACWDYVSLPLLLVVDSTVQARMPSPSRVGAAADAGQEEQVAGHLDVPVPAAASDRVSEAALSCLVTLYTKCCSEAPGPDPDQVLGALQRLAPVCQLPPTPALEQVRALAFTALTHLLRPAADSHDAPQTLQEGGGAEDVGPSVAPTLDELLGMDLESLIISSIAEAQQLAAGQGAGAAGRGQQQKVSGAALAAALAGEDAAPLVGYLIHASLSAAEGELSAVLPAPKAGAITGAGWNEVAEASRGGSKAVQAAALEALSVLIKAVHEPRALAFFLPGITSGLAKQLVLAGHLAGSSAVSAKATSQAVHALTDAICLVLGSEVVAPSLSADAQAASHSSPGSGVDAGAAPASGEDALAMLQKLTLGGSQIDSCASEEQTGGHAYGHPATAHPPTSSPQGPGRLRATIDRQWVSNTVAKVVPLLKAALVPLASHSRPSVRQAVTQAAGQLLDTCSQALGPEGCQLLLEVMLGSAQDEAPAVAQAAKEWLAGDGRGSAPSGSFAGSSKVHDLGHAQHNSSQQQAKEQQGRGRAQMPAGLLDDLLRSLLPAVKRGSSQGRLAANKLSTGMLYAGVPLVTSHILMRPSHLSALVTDLTTCMAAGSRATAQALHMPAESGLYVEQGSGPGTTPSAGAGGPETPAALAASTSGSSNKVQQGSTEPDVASVILVPRMPLCALYLGSLAVYEAVAGVARTLGHLARCADAVRAGGNANHLRRLVDLLVRMSAAASQPRAASADKGNAEGEPWQLQRAAVTAVASEVLVGASSAWHPALPAWGGPGQHIASKPSGADTAFEASVQALVAELTAQPPWQVPTHVPTSASQPPLPQQQLAPAAKRISAQELGCNAVLLRALCDACATAARILGPRLPACGKAQRLLLTAPLSRLADPNRVVAGAARNALCVMALASGHQGSLRRLLAANVDYVTDALCAQLRDLPRHPGAPALLAALLRASGGIAPDLLPLMAEPLAAAVRGLSILSRSNQPLQHTIAFLAAAAEIARGAGEEGEQVAQEARTAQTALKARAEAAEAERRAAVKEAEAAAESRARASGRQAPSAADYFKARLAAQADRELQGPPGAPAMGDDSTELDSDWASSKQGIMTGDDVEEMDRRFRRLHGAALVASAAAEAATPLLMSKDLQVSVSAMEVVTLGLHALQATTPVLEVDAQLLEELGPKGGPVRPVPPETPKLLPLIASSWGPALAALRSHRAPQVERGLDLLAALTKSGGGAFMARRFSQEAAPLLSRLLAKGPSTVPLHDQPLLLGGAPDSTHSRSGRRSQQHRSTGSGASVNSQGAETRGGGAGDDGEAHAPGTLQRVRAGVLGCLTEVCRCKEAWTAVRGLTWAMAQAALPFMSPGHGPVLQDRAAQLLRALHQLDGDTVWLLLVDTVQNSPEGVDTGQALQWLLEGSPPPHPLLPPVNTLLPPLHGRQQGKVSGRLQSHATSRGLSVSLAAATAAMGGSPAHSPAPMSSPSMLQQGRPSSTAQSPSITSRTEAAGLFPTVSRRGSMSGGGGASSSSAAGGADPTPLPPPSALVPTSQAAATWAVTPQLAAACSVPAAALLAELTA